MAKEKKSGRSYLLLGYLNTRPRTTHMMRINNPNPAVRAIEHDPLDHGGHAPGHDDPTGAGHEDAYSTEGEAHSSSSYIDRGKKLIDDGYSRSLTVLGGIHA